jgi:hypothetical protein
MNLYRITVERRVTEVAEVDVREDSAATAAKFVERDMRAERPILTATWTRQNVVGRPHTTKSAAG